MKKELETMFCMLYEECYDFYSDKRHGEDDVGLLFDRGAISAFEWAVVVLASEELKGDAASKAADALKDEAHKDERTGCRKSDDEVAALARVLMGESEA